MGLVALTRPEFEVAVVVGAIIWLGMRPAQARRLRHEATRARHSRVAIPAGGLRRRSRAHFAAAPAVREPLSGERAQWRRRTRSSRMQRAADGRQLRGALRAVRASTRRLAALVLVARVIGVRPRPARRRRSRSRRRWSRSPRWPRSRCVPRRFVTASSSPTAGSRQGRRRGRRSGPADGVRTHGWDSTAQLLLVTWSCWRSSRRRPMARSSSHWPLSRSTPCTRCRLPPSCWRGSTSGTSASRSAIASSARPGSRSWSPPALVLTIRDARAESATVRGPGGAIAETPAEAALRGGPSTGSQPKRPRASRFCSPPADGALHARRPSRTRCPKIVAAAGRPPGRRGRAGGDRPTRARPGCVWSSSIANVPGVRPRAVRRVVRHAARYAWIQEGLRSDHDAPRRRPESRTLELVVRRTP